MDGPAQTRLPSSEADGRMKLVRPAKRMAWWNRAQEALAARIRELTALYEFTDRLQRAGIA